MLKQTTITSVVICVLFGVGAVFVDLLLFGGSQSESNNLSSPYLGRNLEQNLPKADLELGQPQLAESQHGAIAADSTDIGDQATSEIHKETLAVENPYTQLFNGPSLRNRLNRGDGVARYLSSVAILDQGDAYLAESDDSSETGVVAYAENPYEAFVSNHELHARRISLEAELLRQEGVATRSELYLRHVTGKSN